MPATMRDVAGEAGVSIRTVSRVVNGLGEISEETRARVQDVIDALGYRPNVVARGLVLGKTHSVAAVVPQIAHPSASEFLHGVEVAARTKGYALFLCTTSADPQEELGCLGTLVGRRVDGLILYESSLTADALDGMGASPRVVVSTGPEAAGKATIHIAGEAGMHALTCHLIRLGHQAIGHVGWQSPAGERRAGGYRRALADHGVEVQEGWLSFTPQQGVEAGRLASWLLLERAPDITAITCYDDLMAVGVLDVCAETGHRVPQDLAVVGFGGISPVAVTRPSLTTMRVPWQEVGRMAVEMLLRGLAAQGAREEHQEVAPRLVVRDSCGGRGRVAADLADPLGREDHVQLALL